MSDQYSRGILKMVIAQICQMIGWHSINSNPLEFLVDLMQEYLLRLSKLTHQYSEILGRTEANLDDLGLTFQHMHVLIPELLEYVRNVDSVPCIIPIPRFPVCRDDHLNFLKPGSHEVVTRLVHVHEHLPAMYPNAEHVISSEKDETATNRPPDLSDESPSMSITSGSTVQDQTSPPSVFKRPSGLSGSENPILAKRSKIIEEGRPLREIHSVIMTTSGFLSPAREGKLPEPRTPQSTRPDSPPVSSYPMVPPELKIEKKPKKIVKKNLAERKLDKENKKKNQVKELFIPDNMNEMKAKKLARLKDAANKSKSSKSSGSKGHSGNPGSSNKTDNVAINVEKEVSTKTTKSNQTKVKTEKITNETTTPVTISQPKEETVGKLLSEPDKQKLNIFKKISKPREEKIVETQEISRHKDVETRDSLAGPANVLPDDNDRQNDAHVKREEKKTPRTPDVHVNETRESTDIHSPPTNQGYIFDDMSPPGTPSTPKTPEFSVTVPEFKKKKNERNSRKKEQRTKSPSRVVSPKKTKTVVNVPDVEEPQSSERLKTPVQPMEPQFDKKTPNSTTPLAFPFFAPFPSAPGLIPHPIGHPMFPRYPIPMGRNPSGPHPGIPNLPIPPRFMIPNPKSDDFSPPKIQQTSDFTKKSKPVVEEIPEPEIVITNKFEKPVVIKTAKNVVTESEIIHKTHAAVVEKEIQPIVPILPAGTSINVSSVTAVTQSVGKDEKVDKVEKSTKKSKDHKKEKKEKLKKKKEKKEKYKVKDKIKGKKGKIPKLKEKKDKKDKRKEKDKDDNTTEAVPKITLKLNPASPRPPTPDNTPMKKITIKPLAKKVDEDKKRDPSPELAKISALVTRPPKQKVTKAKADAVAHSSDGIDDRKIGDDVPSTEPNNSDQVSRQVWICPACGNQDDGSPMIGCDDCDAWYHWVCVGVQVPPADHEDWYCRLCIAKKQELHDKKKKKRKKRVKQGHGVHQGS